MKKLIRILLGSGMLLLCIALTSCSQYASKNSLNNISLMMTKPNTIDNMHSKGFPRGAIINKFGQHIDVIEYQVKEGKSGSQIGAELTLTLMTFGIASPLLLCEGKISTYWLYFCDDKLVQWGKAGDWTETQKIIYEIHFEVS